MLICNSSKNNDSLEQQKKNAWMIIFNDLLSLLITFFVLIYALSSQASKGKWQELSKELAHQFFPSKIIRYQPIRSVDIEYFYKHINKLLAENPEFKPLVNIEKDIDKIKISMKLSNIFLKDNNLEFSEQGKSLLYFVSSSFFDIKNEVDLYLYVDLNLGLYENEVNLIKYKTLGLILEELKSISLIEKIDGFIKNNKAKSERIEIIINDEPEDE